jgi:hypothetical protein
MLVDNKFISLMIPRCATTSFLHTCQVNKIQTDDVRVYGYTNLYEPEIGGRHFHESIQTLQEKFGYNYPVIGVKRDKISSFVSLWKQTLKMFHEVKEIDLYNKLIKLTYDDILFFNENDYNLIISEDLIDCAIEFCKRNDIEIKPEYLGKFILLYRPKEWYHRNNPNIIWFDFNKLNELEIWVSNQLNKEFKLVNINSSIHLECNLINDDTFKNKFNILYGLKYEQFKNKKSII